MADHFPLCYPCFGCGGRVRRWGRRSRAYESHASDGTCLGAELRLHHCPDLPGADAPVTKACSCGFVVIERGGRRYLWPEGLVAHRTHPLAALARRGPPTPREEAIRRKWYDTERSRGGRLWDTHEALPAEPPAAPPKPKPAPPPEEHFEWDTIAPPEEHDVPPPPEDFGPPDDMPPYDDGPPPDEEPSPRVQRRPNRGGIL